MNQEERLQELLHGFGIEASDVQTELMLKHLELLVEKNSVVNLTRIMSTDEALVTHILDSLVPLPYLTKHLDAGNVKLLDIGTGGGFPGLPLACMTEWDVTLIDSIGKKIAAVNEFIEALGLETRAHAVHTRAEDLARKQPRSFDVVVTRAVAQANVLIEYASPLLKQNGILVLYKAHPSVEELDAAQKASDLCGLSIVSRETFELPNEAGHRELLYFKKSGKARLKLPRRNGMATKEPLGL